MGFESGPTQTGQASSFVDSYIVLLDPVIIIMMAGGQCYALFLIQWSFPKSVWFSSALPAFLRSYNKEMDMQ